MEKKETIRVFCFNREIGVLGWDEHRAVSFFQYHPDFLSSQENINLIPNTRIIRRVKEVQVFKQFNSETFRGLPPMFADSLPDLFGNLIFKSWLESRETPMKPISVMEQLAYVGDRGMGAFEYKPKQAIPASTSLRIEDIVEVVQQVLTIKTKTSGKQLNHESLLNMFKIGTSAGGVRPKILISENKSDGTIIPGDIEFSDEFNHYLVKLHIADEIDYNREVVEYAYYLTGRQCGIRMMDSKLIDNKHFATKRFDRVHGEKIHILSASGLSGWDFKDPTHSSYENVFELALFLKLPHADIEELFRRMVFNIVFANQDDHLKNHSFVYNKRNDSWYLSPAYDITYSLNPLIHYKKTSRALSINQKRTDISLEDVTWIAQKFTIRNYKSIIEEVQSGIPFWKKMAHELNLPKKIIDHISGDFVRLM